jgi:hypothetical protein
MTLLNIFFVSYKTILRRLNEIQYITEKQMARLLDIPDRNHNSDVLLQRMNDASQNRTGEMAFESLVEQALYSFNLNL